MRVWPHHVHTAAVAVVEAPSVMGVQRLLTTHLGASLAARVVVLNAVASGQEGPRWVSPQAMLAAAERVRGEPHRCVVIAHDAAGVNAARCAGMRVVCVPSQVRRRTVVSSLCMCGCVCCLRWGEDEGCPLDGPAVCGMWGEAQYVATSTVEALADAVCTTVGGSEFTVDDLTTPGTFWLNPPLPRDVHGNKYVQGVAPMTEDYTEEMELRRILLDLE